MKPRVFIGSSMEGLPIAQKVKHQLEKNSAIECIVWNDGTVFGLGASYLSSLLKAGSMFDFGILIGSKDDKAYSRGNDIMSPRDNVVFEYGLFMGQLGQFRALLLLQKGAKKPSDLDGIHISIFGGENDIQISKSLQSQVQIISEHIKEKFKSPKLGLLPSTSAAAGFYTNFLERVCDYLRSKPNIEIDKKRYDHFEIQVIIPTKLQHVMQNSASDYFANNKFREHSFKPEGGRPIWTQVKQDPTKKNGLIICDMPTTLTTIHDAIKMYLPHDYSPNSMEFQLIQVREINNFISVLKSKIYADPFSQRVIKFIEYNF